MPQIVSIIIKGGIVMIPLLACLLISLALTKKARIEIIPMIDTIFFLLVFFMISTLSMSQYRGMPVNLPKAASGRQVPPKAPRSPLTKTIGFSSTTNRSTHVTLTSPWSATALPASTHASIATLITSWRRRTGFTA